MIVSMIIEFHLVILQLHISLTYYIFLCLPLSLCLSLTVPIHLVPINEPPAHCVAPFTFGFN